MRALIVDDDPIYRGLILMILRNIESITDIYEAASIKEAEVVATRIKPEFCAIDWMLEDGEGIALGARLLADFPDLKMILVTAFPTKELPRDLIRAGFSGYVDKSASVDRVKEAVCEVLQGGMFFASTIAPQSNPPLTPNEIAIDNSVSLNVLSPRERQIIVLVANGKMSKEIAIEFNLSPRTVDKHRANILRKLNLHDIASLTRWCVRVGLVG